VYFRLWEHLTTVKTAEDINILEILSDFPSIKQKRL
jgi:hypothetical protein